KLVAAPTNGVAEFRLSRRAHADLLDIYAFTEATFGSYQAEAYYSGLERSFLDCSLTFLL
ncbi:MAG: type II toxin-antitoxin system RelE/ParE family toxin, partial [Methylocystis sp.]